ncbi:hypothetical protein [Flavobacterium sp. HNIBRBA15423]|uniref:hypothetical protein n=1 Tax=Flavobacterium sp. HNIBRBA15423 TaxID=3458683 RepID=UPI004044DC9A
MSNNFLKKRIFSGALQFAIYTAAVVALLLFGLILYLHTFSFFGQQINSNNTNIKATDKGFSTVLKENQIVNDTLIIPSFEDSFQITKAISDYWGIFQKTKIVTSKNNKKFQKVALIGSHFEHQDRKTLYLKDLFKPLVVVGNTRIEGTASLAEQGIRPGNIAGNSYYGNQLIYGRIERSSDKLPELNNSFYENIDYLLKYKKPNKNNDYLEMNLKNVNSFFDTTKWLYSNSILTIKDEFIGNIIIKSDTLIRITNTSKLKDIVLIAPTIIIEDNVTGTFQVIASNSIKVGKNVVLNYPSSLILKKNKIDNEKDNMLFIDENSTIKGIVCYFTQNKIVSNFSTELFCSEKSTILGEVYCEGNFELKGRVVGSVYTHQFISNTAGTLFINHLYNSTLTSEKLPDYYSGLLFENQSKSIMKWLY